MQQNSLSFSLQLARPFLVFFCFFVFFKSFWRTHVLFGATGTLFWISGDVSSGFQSQSGFCLIRYFAEANVMYIPQDSPLVLHLPTSWQLARSWSLPHMHVQRWDLARFRTCDRTNRRRTALHCASDPTFFFVLFFDKSQKIVISNIDCKTKEILFVCFLLF